MNCSLKSMTGYGVARGGTATSSLEIIVRSVNGRFLETRIHLPRELSAFEVDLRKIIAGSFGRGSVDVFVSRKARGEKSHLKLFFHEEMAKAWLNVSTQLEKMACIEGKLDINTVLQLPEVVGFEEDQGNLELEAQELRQLAQKACESCLLERRREGEALHAELSQILGRLNFAVQQMTGLTTETNQQLREKMESRLKVRWSEIQLDQQRFQQELALLWDKADITEELGRLKEHMIHYSNLLQSEGSQGKKLDFYTQELLREVNTIGSKSPMAQLTHLVVTAKTEIEKLREQVQNIE
jgi:uncharacterized protein (TIGR00255 family)